MSASFSHSAAEHAQTVVVGLGVTGLSVARHLQRVGRPFTIVDSRENPPELEVFQREMPGVPLFFGAQAYAAIEGAADLIVSPGIALSEPWIQHAVDGGSRIRGDIDLFTEAAQAPVVGITGSNAKSTVTALLGAMAAHAGRKVGVGGNIGTPALDTLAQERQLYVTELSSFQLERSGELALDVATILNVSPDHLDRHASLSAYVEAKRRIFLGARCVVFNPEIPGTVPPSPMSTPSIIWRMSEPAGEEFGLREIAGQTWLMNGVQPLLATQELALPGRHNQANALAALALGTAAHLPLESMLEVLRSFKGLSHRCELIAEEFGVRWINDSKATNVGATLAAIEGFGDPHALILIAGGQGKGADFSPLADAIGRYCRHVLLFGEAAQEIGEHLRDAVDVTLCIDLAEAVVNAQAQVLRGDTVLFSPACASFDQFANFVERGEAFRTLVGRLHSGAGAKV
ncbi:MAG: UDP-N-acetylmuramoyl-L-alanine--D-glutamate ligase [Pseudomonadota bacterium]